MGFYTYYASRVGIYLDAVAIKKLLKHCGYADAQIKGRDCYVFGGAVPEGPPYEVFQKLMHGFEMEESETVPEPYGGSRWKRDGAFLARKDISPLELRVGFTSHCFDNMEVREVVSAPEDFFTVPAELRTALGLPDDARMEFETVAGLDD